MKKHGASGLDEFFNSFKAIEKPLVRENLNILGTIPSNAPYVGLLGTVMGIMKAFNDLAVAPGQGNKVVMAGIGHALVSTAVGLASPFRPSWRYNYFQRREWAWFSAISTRPAIFAWPTPRSRRS